MARLTKRSVESIALPAKEPVYVWDEQLPGFGVKVTANDRRIYIVKYRVGGGRAGRQRWFTLGVHANRRGRTPRRFSPLRAGAKTHKAIDG